MMLLSHTFTVECAHSLRGLGVSRVHGHSYWITVSCQTTADDPLPMDILTGYCALLRGRLDHENLNDLMPQPTMEAIARWVFLNIQGPAPARVRVERPSISIGVEFVPDEADHAQRDLQQRGAGA